MKIFVFIARVFVAATFLFSGFVKLVDPLGSAYKFQEYFGADVLNLEFLIPYALPFSILLILLECILGVAILIGYKPKITVSALFGITLLFLFLTWYSAFFDKVTDCGCFGDALKLSSWETFYKNVVLIAVIVFLMFQQKKIVSPLPETVLKWSTFISFTFFLYITYHVLVHLPLIDFRPYAIGKNIPEGMEFPEDSDELPPVHDFFLESETDDFTEVILTAEKSMLVIAYNLDKSDIAGFRAIKDVAQKAKEKGYLVYGVSASATADLKKIEQDLGLPFEFLFCDETTLKTIIRANPGIVTLEKGTVVGKWNWSDADAVFE